MSPVLFLSGQEKVKAVMTNKRDLYQEVTDTIIAALETCGEWERPWTQVHNGALTPRNVDGRPYRGVNIFLLWASAIERGYASGVWATYKAWQKHHAQVRSGETGTLVTLWKPYVRKASASERAEGRGDKDGNIKSLLLRHYTVFSAEQVDGYELPAAEPSDPIATIERADAYLAATGAVVRVGTDASYSPISDAITCPPRDAFVSSERYYGTLAHEHVHWSGAKARLDRDLSGRFGTEAYAGEELVAELGAAFIGARLGLAFDVREDHASYVKNWLQVLRNDKRAIFTASSQAQKAVDYLTAFSEPKDEADDKEVAAA